MSEFDHDVLGIGNAIVDILSRCDDAFLEAQNLPKGHMQLIDEAEVDRLYSVMGPATEISGGSAANTIAGLASFGAQSAFIGKVSNDQFGRILSHDIRSIGVTFENEPAANSKPTARCLVLVTPDGERTMNTYLGSSVELGEDELKPDLVQKSRILYLEGYLYDPPEAQRAFHRAAELAKEAGARVALSLSDSFCVERHRDAFLSFIRSQVDVLFANEDEIKSLFQTDSFEEATRMATESCDLAALTLGPAGCVVATPGTRAEVAAEPVERVVDTTGAGDLYAAGFLFGLSRNCDLETCARLGGLAAAEIISHIGARPETSLEKLARARNYIS